MNKSEYRGLRVDGEGWVYGSLLPSLGTQQRIVPVGMDCVSIVDGKKLFSGECYEVIPETICRFSGRNDVNGQPVFEGDWTVDQNGDVLEVSYSENFCSFIRQWTGGHELLYTTPWIKVVGNIYENKPSMLKS